MNNQITEDFAIQIDSNYDSCCLYDNPSIEHQNKLKEALSITIFDSVELRKCFRKYSDGSSETFYLVVGKIGETEYSKLIDVEENE